MDPSHHARTNALPGAEARRRTLLALSAVCAAMMTYVGLYQARVLRALVCPGLGRRCEQVADLPSPYPFAAPDGFVAAGGYLVLFALAIRRRASARWKRATLVYAVAIATIHVLGVIDQARAGTACFWCVLAALCGPALVWAARA
ncbi:MAG: hypothetical protein JNK05_38440 [Myxococcales bacterium]|nr:hypothetical protein [Myxococcales bacterium]